MNKRKKTKKTDCVCAVGWRAGLSRVFGNRDGSKRSGPPTDKVSQYVTLPHTRAPERQVDPTVTGMGAILQRGCTLFTDANDT